MHTHVFTRQTHAPIMNLASHGLLTLACGCLLLASGSTQAQSVYRIVGPDGRVTFSDKPPVTPTAKVTPLDNSPANASPDNDALPFELRQVVGKFPVTLYTSSNCAPCESGRSLLRARGVPFSEKTITTAQDAEALQNLSGSTSLPFLTIGGQHVAGYSSAEWTQYLNAAGYPERSRLPASYRPPLVTPLTTAAKPVPVVEAPATSNQSAPAVAAPPRVNQDNPAGIQF